MAYHDDLLAQALMLVNKEPRKPKQASLRRSVSTAYYALFHLLISEAVSNWKHADQRTFLGRSFDHKDMKSASNQWQNSQLAAFRGVSPATTTALTNVAKTFVQLQEKRHVADYDNAEFWTKTAALSLVSAAQTAFLDWRKVRNERVAQDYLLSLLVKKRG